MAEVSPRENEEQEESELTSRRLFMPPQKAPRRAAVLRDLLTTMGLREHAHNLALNHLPLEGDEIVLHLGCGTGTLSVELKLGWPAVEIEGVDADEAALRVASELAEESRLRILFTKGYLQDLPATTERFDWVLCVLSLHLLRGRDRGDAFQEIRRVLKPSGRLLLIDFGVEGTGLRGWLVRRLAAHQTGIADQIQDGLASMCQTGGMKDVQLVGEGPFGLQAVTARKP